LEANVDLRVRDLDSVRHRNIHQALSQGTFERTPLLGLEEQAKLQQDIVGPQLSNERLADVFDACFAPSILRNQVEHGSV
jgi:hypothetical protein